jgi:hypothetical protein
LIRINVQGGLEPIAADYARGPRLARTRWAPIRPTALHRRSQQIYDFQKLRLTTIPNQQYIDLVPSRYEGRFAIVIDAGWDAVDAEVPTTNGTEAYGEVVWS